MANRGRTARLLLVDDNRDNLDVLAILLGERYSVVTCESAEQAFKALEIGSADLLVLDIGMAPIDGVACLSVIRGMPGYRNTPAIALTAFAREVERQAFLAQGFQAVVTKPILDHQQLETLIDSLLDGEQGREPRYLTLHGGAGMIAARGPGKE